MSHNLIKHRVRANSQLLRICRAARRWAAYVTLGGRFHVLHTLAKHHIHLCTFVRFLPGMQMQQLLCTRPHTLHPERTKLALCPLVHPMPCPIFAAALVEATPQQQYDSRTDPSPTSMLHRCRLRLQSPRRPLSTSSGFGALTLRSGATTAGVWGLNTCILGKPSVWRCQGSQKENGTCCTSLPLAGARPW